MTMHQRIGNLLSSGRRANASTVPRVQSENLQEIGWLPDACAKHGMIT